MQKQKSPTQPQLQSQLQPSSSKINVLENRIIRPAAPTSGKKKKKKKFHTKL